MIPQGDEYKTKRWGCVVCILALPQVVAAVGACAFDWSTWLFSTYRLALFFWDKTWLKLMVGWLLLLDTLNSVFGVGFVYRYTIILFGDFAALKHSHWFLNTGPAINATVSSTTQCFFAWRVTKLTGHAWMGWSIAASAFIQTLTGVAISVGSWMVVDFARFKELNAPVTVRLAMSAVTDAAITCILSWYLHSHRTGFPRTDDVITRLIRSTVQTGLVTSLWAVLDLTLFLAVPNNLHTLFSLPLSKICTNSLMSTLNLRGGWDTGMSRVEGASGTANGVSVQVSSVRKCDKTTGRESGRSSVPNRRASVFARHTMGEGDDSFELGEYAKHRGVDLEAGQDKHGALSSLTQVSDAGQGTTRHVEIAQLPAHGTRAGASDEWSINSRSVVADGK